MSEKAVSRQRSWQIKQRAAGRCENCGSPALARRTRARASGGLFYTECRRCLDRNRKSSR